MLIRADARHIPLKDKTVQCCVTSPPYWQLRSYMKADDPLKKYEIGMERSPEEYVANIVAVFREVWRVLHPMGTVFLNLGDSYGATGGDTYSGFNERWSGTGGIGSKQNATLNDIKNRKINTGLRSKNLIGIPWRVAFALQAEGWYLRADIIWAKPNPMPESVRDRPTKAHEYIFLLTKKERYYFDADAVKELSNGWHGSKFHDGKNLIVHPNVGRKRRNTFGPMNSPGRLNEGGEWKETGREVSETRNIRSVWTIATQPYNGAHFSTFPREISERCIKAGSRPGDIVLDPFVGSGTTVMVARGLGRIGIGLDLSYQDLASERIGGTLFGKVVNSAWQNHGG